MNPPSRIGQILVETYRIERLVAEGGMGSVYEARHLRLPKRFAVKFLNLSLIGNHEAQARFRREAEIIAALDHPSVVDLLDYNLTDDGVPFIVLEFLDGEHLGKRILRGPLPLGEALAVLEPVAAALAAAHGRGIVHRDLKPENIVLCRDRQVKVVDFGIAKIRDGQELTALNTILGTVPYMSPEQLFGAMVSPLSDQFALAAITYEMLTGKMAFGGPASVPEVAARVAHYQPADVPGVPQAVNAALFQAMAKDPAARFASVLDFLEAMRTGAATPDEPAPPLLDDASLYGDLEALDGEATTLSEIAPSAPDRAAARPAPAWVSEVRSPPSSVRRAPSAGSARPDFGELRARPSLSEDTGTPALPAHDGRALRPLVETAVIERMVERPPTVSTPRSLEASLLWRAAVPPTAAPAPIEAADGRAPATGSGPTQRRTVLPAELMARAARLRGDGSAPPAPLVSRAVVAVWVAVAAVIALGALLGVLLLLRSPW